MVEIDLQALGPSDLVSMYVAAELAENNIFNLRNLWEPRLPWSRENHDAIRYRFETISKSLELSQMDICRLFLFY